MTYTREVAEAIWWDKLVPRGYDEYSWEALPFEEQKRIWEEARDELFEDAWQTRR